MGKRNVAVTLGTKWQLDELKQQLGFKTLSETVAYLIAHYNETWGGITKLQDRKYRDEVETMERQTIII